MMAMGYFRAPRRLYGRKREGLMRQRESVSASLLVADGDGDDGAGEAAAAAGAVPKGYFAVYVGAEARRFVVPTSYLAQPAFRELMERAAEEFGFGQAGGLRIPCREEDFEATVAALEKARRRGGSGPTRSVGLYSAEENEIHERTCSAEQYFYEFGIDACGRVDQLK
ncbi:hypothetical protein U9M48_031082 [Paspalum notatum var. saurae]|uniref:Uncharacterized protein n=1 Tax=Paspalum notatum var. saurae TaxID=547442 RepID=A0AAQ3X2Z1_PASNO